MKGSGQPLCIIKGQGKYTAYYLVWHRWLWHLIEISNPRGGSLWWIMKKRCMLSKLWLIKRKNILGDLDDTYMICRREKMPIRINGMFYLAEVQIFGWITLEKRLFTLKKNAETRRIFLTKSENPICAIIVKPYTCSCKEVTLATSIVFARLKKLCPENNWRGLEIMWSINWPASKMWKANFGTENNMDNQSL